MSGDQPWDFFAGNDAKAETPVLWPPQVKSWLIGKDSDAGRDWGQEEKGTTEDEMAGWHHWLNGRESEWTPGVGDGQGGLACCDSWVAKSWTWLSNWTELKSMLVAQLYPTLFVTSWTVVRQAPLFMVFSRQEYWSGYPFPFPIHTYTNIYARGTVLIFNIEYHLYDSWKGRKKCTFLERLFWS